MKFTSKTQLVESLRLLVAFRKQVDKQAAQHILPFLALRSKGVGTSAFSQYSESDDFKFFDDYARVRSGEEPYYDPFAAMMRVAGHPHSNAATLRKNTFFHKWHAGELDKTGDNERWRLTPDYLQILKTKVKKGKSFVRVPAVPLALYLFRGTGFEDSATWEEVGGAIKDRFHLNGDEFNVLFETSTRPMAVDFSPKPLSGDDVLAAITDSGVLAETREKRSTFQSIALPTDDPVLNYVRQLIIEDGFAGVIFVGPPGTSKSWYAVQVALSFADGNAERVTRLQFHPSFQYEHFVQGFVPNEDGDGFELTDQIMLQVIKQAEDDPAATFVILIDELSRSDPGRVFGELLTYIEPTRRDEEFTLASGDLTAIPKNIVFLATMNSRDKSVAEIDDAFDRRFAKIEFPPDEKIAERLLRDNKVDDALVRRILGFFNWVVKKYPLGHAFFYTVRDEESLKRLWNSQLKFVFEKHFKYEPETLAEIRAKFEEITGLKL